MSWRREGVMERGGGTHHPPHASLVLLPLAGHVASHCWENQTPERDGQQGKRAQEGRFIKPPTPVLLVPLHRAYERTGMQHGGVEKESDRTRAREPRVTCWLQTPVLDEGLLCKTSIRALWAWNTCIYPEIHDIYWPFPREKLKTKLKIKLILKKRQYESFSCFKFKP